MFYIASNDPNGGIYECELLGNELSVLGLAKCSQPMYLAINERRLYAVLFAPFRGSNESAITSFEIDDDGLLGESTGIVPTNGVSVCHLHIGQDVYVVNYSSGNVVLLPNKVVSHSGSSIHPTRQTGPHTHMITPTPDGKFLAVCDLGLDKIIVYDKLLNKISEVQMPLGHGPRHITFSKCGCYAYCANELESTVSSLEYKDGVLTLIDTVESITPEQKPTNLAAAIRLCGDKLYVSHRGVDVISEFLVDGPKLTHLRQIPCYGKAPRDFIVHNGLLICTNEKSNNVTIVDIKTEALLSELKDISAPLCVIEG